MIVSKSLPTVAKLTVILAGAVQVYQTEAPPGFPAIVAGSPVSFVAPMLLPLIEPLAPTATWALAKLSLAGWANDSDAIKMEATTAKIAAIRTGNVIPPKTR